MKILFTIPTEDGVRERFQGIAPHAEFVFADSAELSESDIESADILIGNVPPTMLHAPAGLRFFQTYTAGANAYTVPGVLDPETVLCNASGAGNTLKNILGIFLLIRIHTRVSLIKFFFFEDKPCISRKSLIYGICIFSVCYHRSHILR